jgi:predicted acylesterase/phospholipase RssA
VATEVRWALALNGGVSLAIWIAGLCDELLRIVNASNGEDGAEPAYVALTNELDVTVKIDVLAGTSAGGLNGGFLATALSYGCRDLTLLRNLWMDAGAFSSLLREPHDAELPSLLRGDSYFLVHIEECLLGLAKAGTGLRALEPPLDLRLTATALDGRLLTIPDGEAALHTVDHRVEFRFSGADFDFAAEPHAAARIARASRSTASFPGAFEPSGVPVGLFEHRHAPAIQPEQATSPVYLVDGGVLANLPAEHAVDAIIAQPSRERVERVLGLVVPDPGGPPKLGDDTPAISDTVSRSAVGIPRNQCLTDFVAEVRDHNQEVLGRRAARVALFRGFSTLTPAEAWQRLVTVSDVLFPSYRAARHRTSLDRMANRLSGRLSAQKAASIQDVAASGDLGLLPWVPASIRGADDGAAWGGSPVRRVAALLITWTNLAAAVARGAGDDAMAARLLARKQSITAIRASADRLSPRGVLDELVAEQLAADDNLHASDALRSAAARWASDEQGMRPAGLGNLIDQLADHLHFLIEQVRPHLASITDEDTRATLAGLAALHDGAPAGELRRVLIGIEVIEVSFSASDPRPDQLIRLAQFSSTQHISIDPLGRDEPAEKLAGVQLGHFAAFLKRSWRANDFLWGRLDAAQRAVQLLDQVTGDRLANAGRLDAHIRAVQAAVLREELPLVVSELEKDRRSGARVSPEADTFIRAVTAAGKGSPAPDEPISLEGVSEEDLGRLLGLNRIGLERLSAEAGSALTESVALTALATGTQLLRRQQPKGLRLPLRVMASGSLTAWRVRRLDRVRRLLLRSAVVAVELLAAAVIYIDVARTDLSSPLVVPAWFVLVAIVLFQLVQAVPLLRIMQRRRAGRPPRTTSR